ncbi:hypothetical protein NOR_04765 [Metarhizium rileyi]|uniref:SWI5-dependent HO expression protein 3 n=1 Tax=Metarhizium rileyi (strain RCEF 4871) TaxID=1649241 RepID=A0A167DNH7_METRR|nr:hypothetical protein NOR_04765 [Metarhizium rileyi RCEF 4871]TWU77129.1 hypothetical protein ED733_008327 [Metarhizium rileyi]
MLRKRLQKREFAIHWDTAHALKTAPNEAHLNASSTNTLAPASTGSINGMTTTSRSANNAVKQAIARSATIRSVPSFDGSESSPDSCKRSALSSSFNSTASTASAMPGSDTQYDRISSTAKLKQDNGTETISPRWHTNGVRTVESSLPHDASTVSEEAENGQWDSTIGKAGLGKTGRVINKLVSDNDALKRDIQIERLRAEEAKQAAKLLEDKMDRMMNEYEGRLLEANVTKTLLARKERQVESLTSTVELEKKKTQLAMKNERSWKDELDRVKNESKIRVEEATSYAQLMEGRYNAISSHWRDQGDEVKRAVSKMKGEITTIVDERRSDDEKITTLRDLCEQQDNNIKELRRENEEIARLFEEYKRTQEESLRGIKTDARKRQEEQEKQLCEAREALHKLKWALSVNETSRAHIN